MQGKNFIETVFEGLSDDEAVCVTHPKGELYWNFYSDEDAFQEFLREGCYTDVVEEDSWYMCISSVKRDGRASRKVSDLMLTYCIVLDDIGTKVAAEDVPVLPSWVMETSEGNFQYGYLLEPTEDTAKVTAIIAALIERGLCDAGSRGAYRVVRVPGSRNIKPKADGWCSQLVSWEPDRYWTLDELMTAFSLTEDDLVVKARGQVAVPGSTTAGHASLRREQVEDLLSHLPESWKQEYAQWELVGKALYRLDRDDARLHGSGLELWTEWSVCDAYDGSACAGKWDVLVDEPDLEANPFTVGSLIYEARQHGWERRAVSASEGERITDSIGGLEGEVRNFLDARMGSLGFTDSPVNWDNVARALPYCFVDPKGAKFFIRADGSQSPVPKDRELEQMKQEFGDFLDMSMVLARADEQELAETKKKEFLRNVISAAHVAFWSVVTRHKVVHDLQMQVDMFAEEMTPHMHRNAAVITLPWRGLMCMEGDVADAAVVADYKAHNPHFDDIIEFVVMSRFASNRKLSYMWMQGDSDFGKGFLFAPSGVFGGLGLVASVSVREIEKALEGSPVGISRSSLVDAWVLWIDEFKGVKSEIKELDNTISASPKNQLKFTTPLYVKMFTSAEDVASLTGEAGVEDQFARRFSYIRGNGQLSARALHKRGSRHYTGAVRVYASSRINELVAELQSLGPVGAGDKAEEWLREYHDRAGITRSFNSLDDAVAMEAAELRDLFQRVTDYMWKNDTPNRAVMQRVFNVDEGVLKALFDNFERGFVQCKKACIIRKPYKIVSLWLESRYDRSEVAKMGWKKRQIVDLVDPENGYSNVRFTDEKNRSKVVKSLVTFFEK